MKQLILALLPLALCSCALTASRSPSVIERGRFAGGLTYTGGHDLSGPKTLDAGSEDQKAPQTNFPWVFVSYGFAEETEFSVSGFYGMTVGGLYGQIKHRLFTSAKSEFTII